MPQARITAKNISTGGPRTALSDESGIYRITNLVSGSYEVLIEKPGFKSLEFSQIALTVDHVQNLDATLTVSNVSISERARVEFRVEAYDLFNRVPFNQPGNLTSDPGAFGQSTGEVTRPDGTSGARQVQLGLRFQF